MYGYGFGFKKKKKKGELNEKVWILNEDLTPQEGKTYVWIGSAIWNGDNIWKG